MANGCLSSLLTVAGCEGCGRDFPLEGLIEGDSIPILIDMRTTIRLPPHLLESVDRRARELGLSRNRYIVGALDKALQSKTRWSLRLVEELDAARRDVDAQQLLEELRTAVSEQRLRKAPPAL